MESTKNPAPGATGNGAVNRVIQPRQNSKLARIFRALMAGHLLTWKDAYERFGCAALHSAISTLQQSYGVRIDREYIKVEGVHGSARVARYWISQSERRRILNSRQEAA